MLNFRKHIFVPSSWSRIVIQAALGLTEQPSDVLSNKIFLLFQDGKGLNAKGITQGLMSLEWTCTIEVSRKSQSRGFYNMHSSHSGRFKEGGNCTPWTAVLGTKVKDPKPWKWKCKRDKKIMSNKYSFYGHMMAIATVWIWNISQSHLLKVYLPACGTVRMWPTGKISDSWKHALKRGLRSIASMAHWYIHGILSFRNLK